jgi:tripartite ATP-independent transporter DctP family solute receptor
MKKFLALLMCVLLTFALLAGCGNSDKTNNTSHNKNASNNTSSEESITLKLGHMSPLENNYNLLAEKFKALVEEKSNGRIKIQIYPQAQLGYDRDLLEAMQFGNVDLAVNTSAPISNFEPLFGVLDMPYLFKDWDHIESFIKSDVAKDLLSECLDENLVGLAFMPRGFRSVTNNVRPIYKPEDLKGIKLRVIESPAYVKTFEDLGAVVSAMSWGEVYTALQQGAIDGQENPPETVKTERVYEVQKYFSLNEHIAAFAAIMASKSTWDKLSEDDQKILRESAVEAAVAQGNENRKTEADIIKELNDKLGLKVNRVEDKSLFATKTTSAYKWFEQECGQEGKAYIDKIKALAK